MNPLSCTPEFQIMTDRELLTIVSQAWGAISCVTAGARLEIKSNTNPVSCRRAPVPCFLRSFSAFSLRFSPCPFLWFLSPGPVGCSCQRLPEPHWSLYQLFPLPGVTFIALQLSHQSVKPYPAKPGAAGGTGEGQVYLRVCFASL